MIDLHWSLDHAHHGGEQRYHETLCQVLQTANEGCAFTLLPNYWQGYSQPEEPFACGDLVIQREACELGYAYMVGHHQAASGEELELRYRCGREPQRPLRGNWRIRTVNHAGDSYRGFNSTGRLREEANGRRLELCIAERLNIPSALLPHSCQPTPQWSLFDCLGEMIAAEVMEIDLLEDGEKPRLHGRLLPLDDWTLVIDGHHLTLHGQRLQGPGQAPSHWWLDENGRVILVSTTFVTYVRRGGLV